MREMLRLRIGTQDAHYGGQLVDGARLLELFGDVATLLLIRCDGDEGLFRAYEAVEFLAPVRAGDILEVEGEIVRYGESSRDMRFEARKVASARPDLSDSAAEIVRPPVVVCRAKGACVVPRDKRRVVPGGRPGAAIVTAAIVGAETTREQNPSLPLTAEEIGEEARRCVEAGASVIHLHAREPDGRPTQSLERFRECIEAIRARVDVVIQTSTGGAIGMGIDERCQPLALRPEMATLNVGSMNFGDAVFLNAPHDVEQVARRILEHDIVPEIEIYDAGHLDIARALLAKGLITTRAPLHFQFVLGVRGGLAASERSLDFLIESLPEGALWSVAGVGRHQMPMAGLAILRGGHPRVGLEDNIYLDKGVLAEGSAPLVDRIARFARERGREPATVAEARSILGTGRAPGAPSR